MPLARLLRRLDRCVRALGIGPSCNLLYGRWLRRRQPTRMALDGAILTLRPRSSDFLVFTDIFVDGIYAIDDLPEDPAVVVDCGANVGFASILFARRWPRARILAIEPEASNFTALCANVRTFPNVTPLRAAIWPQDERLEVTDPNVTQWGFQVRPDQHGQAGVRGISLGTLLKEHAIERVDLLKIDIEGAERDLFAATDLGWMDHVHTLVVELHEERAPGVTAAFTAMLDRRSHRRRSHAESEIVVFEP